MKHIVVIITGILFLFSCKEEVLIIPPGTLSQDSMAVIIADMQIAEAMYQKNGQINQPLAHEKVLIQYTHILRKYNITRERFDTSYSFYKDHTQIMEAIYDKALNELSRKKAEMVH